ncbi:hypothetical protein HZC31_05850 [Candidatus Woesearchaeota archaeon]|nr:hypothetical protein [Candidatus Woesearchaeota archaeon]
MTMDNTAILMEIESARTLTDPSERYAAFEDIAFRNEAAPVEYALAVTELGMLHVSRGEYLIASAYFQEAAEKDPNTVEGIKLLEKVFESEKDSDKKVEVLYSLLRPGFAEYPRHTSVYILQLAYDELVDICLKTGREAFLRSVLPSCNATLSQHCSRITPLERRIHELELATLGLGETAEMHDPINYSLPTPEDNSIFEIAEMRISSRIPFWLQRREWINLNYKQMYLHGIVIAGEVFDYLASLDSSKGAEQKKAVAYAEATVEYAALRRSSSISETITSILTPVWGQKTYNERLMAIYALDSLDKPGKWRVNTPYRGNSSITTVALAHLGHHTDTFPQTMYERIQYCGRALIDIEQQKDVPPFWKHIYGQVLTGYVEKLIKNDGLVKL